MVEEGPLPIDCKKVVARSRPLTPRKLIFRSTPRSEGWTLAPSLIISSDFDTNLFYGRRLIHLLLSSVDTFAHQNRHILSCLSSVPPLGLFIAQIRAMSN
jgi:hypothetical protein